MGDSPIVSLEELRRQHDDAAHATKQGTGAGSGEKPFDLIWASDAHAMLDRPYIVKGVIGQGELGAMYGRWKSGKTFLALDMGMSVATGQHWFGHRVSPGLVIYIASEAGPVIQRRVRAWLDRHPGAAKKDVPFAIVPRAVNLLADADLERLFQTIDALVAKHGPPVLIIVDTLARSMAGGDENSALDMGRAIAVADWLRDRYQTATMFIHHAGKDVAKGARGSSALVAAADVVIQVSADGAGNHRAIIEWSREGAGGSQYAFRLPIVELGKVPRSRSGLHLRC